MNNKKGKDSYFWKHGFSYSEDRAFYSKYRAMHQRCTNPKVQSFKFYGGSGIECEWQTFESFRDDMYESYKIHSQEHGKSRTTIERIDHRGNYSRENCRWATPKEQGRNKRNNIVIEYDGQTKCLKEWSEVLGIGYLTLYSRIARGWGIDKSFTHPVR